VSIFIQFFLWWAPKDASFLEQNAYRPFKVIHVDFGCLAPIERAYATSYYWLIVTLVLSCTVSEIRRVIGWKLQIFPNPPLFDPPPRVQEEPVRFFRMKLSAQKLEGWATVRSKLLILTSTVFDWSTRVSDRQGRTNGIAVAYTALSIASRGKKRKNVESLIQVSCTQINQITGIRRLQNWVLSEM